MHHLFAIAALLICSASLHAQTLKSLMYNSTNGQVVANTGTNVLRFTNDVSFGGGPIITGDGIAYAQGTNIVISFELQKLLLGNQTIFEWQTNQFILSVPLAFNSTNNASSNSRVNLGIPLLALTNTSNVTMMRALSGSTNTNEPYSGSISVIGTNNTNTLVFSNGILQSVQ